MRSAPIAVLASLIGLSPTATAATWGMPEALNDRLELMTDLYLQMLLLGTLVFIVVFGWMGYNLVKFRPGGDGKASNETHRGSMKAEVIWTVIPLLIVAWIGFVSYDGIWALEQMNDGEDNIEIEVNAYQWSWEFDYGDDVVLSQTAGSGGSLEDEDPFLIPANKPVTVNVTGQDVQHAFKITDLGVMVDAIPYEDNHVTFTAPEGEYLLQCAEMCGNPGHAYMNAWVHAVPEDEFDAWLEERRAEAQGAEIEHRVDVELTGDGFDQDEYVGIAGVDNAFNVSNQDDQERTFQVEDTNLSTTIPAGETAVVNGTLEAGTFTLTSNEDSATVEVQEAERVNVDLLEWAVEGETTTFETGTPYILNVENVGSAPHNLYIGEPTSGGEPETLLWNTEDIRPGDRATLLMIPTEDEAGSWQWWCEISGHYAQGMVDDITIE